MTNRSSRPPPTPQELIRRREQLLQVLKNESITEDRRLLEDTLEEIDAALDRTGSGPPPAPSRQEHPQG